ncbi:MAG: integrase core domain-containing protein, partial [bacterium]
MMTLSLVFAHIPGTIAKLLRPGGAKALAAENLLLRIQEIEEINTVSHAPISHPFTERLIGAIRRECLDLTLFLNERDLEEKLEDSQDYYNVHRVHQALDLKTPEEAAGKGPPIRAKFRNFTWKSHCRVLF